MFIIQFTCDAHAFIQSFIHSSFIPSIIHSSIPIYTHAFYHTPSYMHAHHPHKSAFKNESLYIIKIITFVIDHD